MMRFKEWLQRASGPASKRFHRYVVMWAMAWVAGLALTLALFLRATPYSGAPYVLDLAHYLPHAIYYMTYGLTLIAAPFMLCSLFIQNDEEHTTRQRVFRTLCAILLLLSLIYQHIDNETLRYCNMHITVDFLRTYLLGQGVPIALWTLLEEDAGGSNVSFWLMIVPTAFAVCWFAFGTRIPMPKFTQKKMQWALFGVIIISFLFLPWLFRTDLFGSKNRQAKVAPPAILLMDAINTWREENDFPENIKERMLAAQEDWKKYNQSAWELTTPEKPWVKHYNGTCPPADKKYNFIIISFESFRAQSLNLFNSHETIEATPYMNSMALSDKAAYYTNYYTNGHPTIAGFMALHTGLLPHSNRTVAKAFTADQIDSFVNTLRKQGWQTIFFGGSDPDWDNQRPWLMRWYDDVSYKPENDELDRNVMHDVKQWLTNERDASKPFMITTFLISNHMPFQPREDGFIINNGTELKDKIYNTMRYDDDVLREFVESIRNEPWFDDTIIVLTGDHGLDLGDRDGSPDYNNLRTEAIHIPLILYGTHPRLPKGKQTTLSSHIDLGSTILDLAGICEDNATMGYSILNLSDNPERAEYAFKADRASVRTSQWTAYIDETGKVMLFDKEDDLQLQDISKDHPKVAEAMKKRADDMRTVVDYNYQNNLFNP